MITIQKSHDDLREVNRKLIILAVKKTLSRFNKADVDVTIRLTNDEEITRLNKEYRGISSATDVLSFNQEYKDPQTGQLYLGDIVISLDTVINQAPQYQLSIDQECAFLAIHGTLHLLGYDHYTPEEKALMWEIQDKIFLETNNIFQKED